MLEKVKTVKIERTKSYHEQKDRRSRQTLLYFAFGTDYTRAIT